MKVERIPDLLSSQPELLLILPTATKPTAHGSAEKSSPRCSSNVYTKLGSDRLMLKLTEA